MKENKSAMKNITISREKKLKEKTSSGHKEAFKMKLTLYLREDATKEELEELKTIIEDRTDIVSSMEESVTTSKELAKKIEEYKTVEDRQNE
jgi:hypothetical protein